jgi:acid phosphatase (class A)
MMSFFKNKGEWSNILSALVILAIIAGCTSTGNVNRSETDVAPRLSSGSSSGYLSPEAIPSSLTLVPPPPAAGSAAIALDEEISRRSFALRDTSRWLLAISDADLAFPHSADTFSCALNTSITEADAPRLYNLLRRSMIDVGSSTATAKNHYRRTRPFVLNKEPLCTPDDQAWLETNGSYPSGHSAIGWGWALILSEISPEQTDAILARGRAFGESRNVCNVHWQSDVIQGRLIAAGTVARLHADPAFRADLESAKAELADVRRKDLKPTRDCNVEAEALALQPQMAP